MKTFRRTLPLLFVAALTISALAAPFSTGTSALSAEPPVIRVAPPAPVFDTAKRQAELAQRRQKVAEAIGPKSILVLFSAEPRVYTNDVDYHFRQENNLFYLTHLNQKRSVLVSDAGHIHARNSFSAAT